MNATDATVFAAVFVFALSACSSTSPPSPEKIKPAAKPIPLAQDTRGSTTLEQSSVQQFRDVARVEPPPAYLPKGDYAAYCVYLHDTAGQQHARARVLAVGTNVLGNPAEQHTRSGWPTEKPVRLNPYVDTVEVNPAVPETAPVCEDKRLIQAKDTLQVSGTDGRFSLVLGRGNDSATFALLPPDDLDSDNPVAMYYRTDQLRYPFGGDFKVQYFVYLEDWNASDPDYKIQRYRLEAFAVEQLSSCLIDMPKLGVTVRKIEPGMSCQPGRPNENGVGIGNEPR